MLVQYRHYHTHTAKTFCTVCALSRDAISSIAKDYPVFGKAMANIVRIFAKKMRAKNPDADLDQVVSGLLASGGKEDEDDDYTHKVHLSDVYKEVRTQAKEIAGMRKLLEDIADKVGVERS